MRNRRLACASGLLIVLVGCSMALMIPGVFAGNAKSRYRVNSRSFASDPTFRSVLRGSPISLNARGLPAKKVLREIGRQSGVDVAFHHAFDRGSDKPLSVRFEDAPFWVAVAEVCKAGGWPCRITTEPAVRVYEDGDTPIDGYQAKGPFFLLWSVLKDGSIQCRLLCEPGSDAGVHQPRVDPEFRVVLSNGRRLTVKPEQEVQDGMLGRIWKWSSNKAFAGAARARRVELELEVFGIVDLQEVRVPWRSEQSRRVGKNQLKVGKVRQGIAEDWDPDRFGEKAKFHEFTAQIELSNEATKAYERIMAAKRQPNREEWNSIRITQDGGLGVRQAWVLGTSGEQLRGTTKMTGTSGRYRPVRCEVRGRTTKPDFEARELFLLCGGTRKVVGVTFKVENVPLRREPK